MRLRNKPASLTVQVMQAERHVLDRRRLVVERATLLGRNLRRKMTSPVTLLLAGVVGFAAGYFKRQAPVPGNPERKRDPNKTFFAKVLKLLAFARTVARVLPTAVPEPSVPYGVPDQAPEPRFSSDLVS